jgi:hypothetical protein
MTVSRNLHGTCAGPLREAAITAAPRGRFLDDDLAAPVPGGGRGLFRGSGPQLFVLRPFIEGAAAFVFGFSFFGLRASLLLFT